jgi:hypothetical protein
MRRRFLPFALVVFFAAEALSLIGAVTAWHCACPIKSACCREAVCPMDAARHARGTAFETCGGGNERFALAFVSWRALLPTAALVDVPPRTSVAPEAPVAHRLEGEREVAERPPRLAPRATA